MSIVGIILSVILFNYTVFSDSLGLTAAGQEMAIAVRQAQTYGLSVKEVRPGGGNFDSAYGVHFDVNSPNGYLLFADVDGSKTYDAGNGCGSFTTECIERFYFRNGITISPNGLCDGNSCPPQASVRMMDITFLRPNPDARIYFTNNGGMIKIGPSLTGKVLLVSKKNKTITLTIESTGQVLAQ